jgi:class 3 adenylate cyclase
VLLALVVGVPASYLAFHGGGYAVDFILPVVATGLTGLGAEVLARRRFRDSFGRYVGRAVMEEVLADNPTLRGERREVSVLVSDLRGFTTLSETLPAERVAAHLNEYFPAMIDAIFAERGMVTVNVAARLEGVNKELGTSTLVTAETQQALGDRVEARYCGDVPVKGRAQPLRVYELLALRETGGRAAAGPDIARVGSDRPGSGR